jgi:cell division protein FtsB
MEIGAMVRDAMKDHYSYRTIRRVLPESAKHIEFKHKEDKMSSSEREPLDLSNKVTVENTEHQFNTKGMGVAVTDDTEQADTNNIISNVLGVNVRHITEADLHKENSELRQENKFLKDSVAFFKNNNKSLRKKIEEYQKIPSNDALVNQIDQLNKELSQVKEEYEQLRQGNEWLMNELEQLKPKQPKVEPKKDLLLQK